MLRLARLLALVARAFGVSSTETNACNVLVLPPDKHVRSPSFSFRSPVGDAFLGGFVCFAFCLINGQSGKSCQKRVVPKLFNGHVIPFALISGALDNKGQATVKESRMSRKYPISISFRFCAASVRSSSVAAAMRCFLRRQRNLS